MTSSGSAAKILLVLPPGATTSAAVAALRAEGYEVEEAANVYRAVSAFTAAPADLVVLGLLPLEDRDLQVIPVLRGIRADVRILATFPPDARDRAVKAVAAGADSYILEPFYLGELVDLVRRGLERVGSPAATGSGDLEELAGAVAHAVNNPLQILELMLSGDPEAVPDAKEFRQETKRIEVVVAELLAFSRRFEAGTRPVDVNRLVRDTIPAGKGRKPRVRHDLSEDLPAVTGDEVRLGAALAVAAGLANAGEKTGRLFVRTDRAAGGRVRIVLAAPDAALTEEEGDELFRPFAGPIKGAVGLAGATARAVIEAHGGEVSVTAGEGDGTEVTILLPAR